MARIDANFSLGRIRKECDCIEMITDLNINRAQLFVLWGDEVVDQHVGEISYINEIFNDYLWFNYSKSKELNARYRFQRGAGIEL